MTGRGCRKLKANDPANHHRTASGLRSRLYRRTDIFPERSFQTLGRARKVARDEIERLINWLDAMIDIEEDFGVNDEGCDGDAEPLRTRRGNRPSLAASYIVPWIKRGWSEID